VTESELQKEIVGRARRLGLFVRYSVDSRRITDLEHGRGFPDLEIWGARELLVAEVKTEGALLSGDQRKWRYRIEQAGIGFRVLRPAQLASGAVDIELRRLAG
jgi:VRR-NUC domain-containing protein